MTKVQGPAPDQAQLQTVLPGLVAYVTAIYQALGVTVQARVTNQQVQALTVDLQAAHPGQVIGRRGRRINAAETLATAWLVYQGVADPGLVLDTAGYRDRRRQVVATLATRTALTAVTTGQAAFLDPMPARERRELHQQLAANPQVETYSRGQEPFRGVVVVPKRLTKGRGTA